MTDPIDITDLHRKAAALHQSGRLDDAEQFYQTILHHDPNHMAVLTNLGTLAQGVPAKRIVITGLQTYKKENLVPEHFCIIQTDLRNRSH